MVLSAVYHWTAEQRARDLRPAPEERGAVRRHAHEDMVRGWEEDMSRAQFGRRTLDAIGPNLDRWLERPHGFLTYRLVQVLTGHGCFGNYLHKIGREESPSCHECGAAVDSAQHTLAVCPGWEEQRRVLVGAVGQDLSLPSIVNAMLDDERAWKAMASFCETVMSQKEAAEREREDDPSAPPLRRRRRGRRRRAYDRSSLAPPGGQQVVGTGVPPPALHAPPPSRGNSAVSPAIPPIPPSQGGGAGPAS
ncbi:hypothetical protein ABMA27_016901 [Loxostege sticticalis]|uniref:Reverse transcriptase n=1 Tax=Loxostege sticticalis TaxID=481309 RepID=A0ABR3GZ30_LOXSC